MRYTKQQYEECEFYPWSEEEKNYSRKVIKPRLPHTCANCGNEIGKGEHCLKETCVFEGEGWRSAYTCLSCLDYWIKDHE